MKPEEFKAALIAKKAKDEAVKLEYVDKAKTKALTQGERLDRIEKLLGLDK